jgi:hypothetical protein
MFSWRLALAGRLRPYKKPKGEQMHTNSKLLFEKYALPYFQKGMKVLEIGPDLFPSGYQRIVENLSLEWHTLDMYDSPKLTYPKSSAYSFAIPDGFYDIVLSGQVIEHVKKPWKWMPELTRITKAGGLVITINPVSWVYHEEPVDCWRIYPEGMKALYEEASLTVLLSLWESLEQPHYQTYLQGISRECQGRTRRVISGLLRRFGFPGERSYDTITIGRK